MIRDMNRRNYRLTVLTEYDGLTCHKRNQGGGCISPVLRVSHNSLSRLALSCCVTHKSVGILMVHVPAFDVRAFVLMFPDASTRECRKCFQISVAFDFARFGFEDESSFVGLGRL